MNFRDLKTIDDLEKIYPQHILDKFPKQNRGYYSNIDDKDWFDWRWQIKNRITALVTLGGGLSARFTTMIYPPQIGSNLSLNSLQ